MKKIQALFRCSSMFGQPKWLKEITISGFSSSRKYANKRFMDSIQRLVDRYNEDRAYNKVKK